MLSEESKTIINNAISYYNVKEFLKSQSLIGNTSFVLQENGDLTEICDYINNLFPEIKAEKVIREDILRSQLCVIKYKCFISRKLVFDERIKSAIARFDNYIKELQDNNLIYKFDGGSSFNILNGDPIRVEVKEVTGYDLEQIREFLLAKYPHISADNGNIYGQNYSTSLILSMN